MSDSKYEIEIKTTADLKAAKEYLASLRDQQAALRKLGQDASGVASQIEKIEKVIEQSGKSEGKGFLGGGAELLSSGLARLAIVAGSVSEAMHFAKESVKAFAEQETSVAKLDAALARNGQLTDATHEKYNALAESLAQLTGTDHGDWLEVLARLTQFGAQSENIDKYAEAVKNLAGVLDGDLNGAALLVSRAIQGNFTAFRRWGIQLDQNASQTDKLNQLFTQLAQRGGGQLEARSKTLVGQFHRLSIAYQDVQENVGGLISDSGILQAVMGGLTYVAQKVAGALDAGARKTKDLANAQASSAEAMGESEDAARKWQDRLEAINKETQIYTIRLEAQRAKIEQVRQEQEQLNKANTDAQLARIDQAEKSGAISPAQSIELRARTKLAGEQRTRKSDAQAAQANLDLHFQEQTDQARKVSGIQTEIQQAKLKAKKQAEESSAQAVYNDIGNTVSDIKQKRDKAVTQYHTATLSGIGTVLGGPGPEEIAQYESDLAQATVAMEKAKSQWEAARAANKATKGNPEQIPQLQDRLKQEAAASDILAAKKDVENEALIRQRKAILESTAVTDQTTATQVNTERISQVRTGIEKGLESGGPLPNVQSITPYAVGYQQQLQATQAENIRAFQALMQAQEQHRKELEAINRNIQSRLNNGGTR